MTVPMALVDLIPVILFFMAAMTLLHDLYHMMSKGAFALLAAGLIVISCAGFYKALWKLLYAMNICDFAVLNTCFFPMQSTGFLIGGLGMVSLLCFRQKSTAYAAAVPAVYSGTMLFVFFTVLGTAGIWGSLAAIAAKMKKKNIMFLFLISFVCMLGMGYLSTKDFADPKLNWIAEAVNIIGMALFFTGVRSLHQAGLETFQLNH